jgi:AraC-like DNA-binding protein/mannose-6-phosphate isomerase-like protein (cupin superfamily)
MAGALSSCIMSSTFRQKDFLRINDSLHAALISLGDFQVGAWWMRCVEFHFGKGRYVPGDHYGWHLHKELQFEIPLSGQFEFSIKKSKKARIRSGEVLVLPPDNVHRWKCLRGGMMIGISLAPLPHADSVVMPLGSWLNPSVVKLPMLPGVLELLLEELGSHPTTQDFATKRMACWIYLVVTQILGACLGPPSVPQQNVAVGSSRSQRLVSKMIRYIDANISGNLSMAHFEKTLGISARQIHRVFTEVTGVSCHKYVMERRLEVARSKFQSNPEASVKEVAYSSGFTSPAHFSSKFKSTFGVRPNDYR